MAATLDDVRNLLPDQAITATSRPTDAQALALMATTRNWATGRVGDLSVYPVETQTEVAATLDSLVAMGAAGLVSNAAHPDRAGRGANSYGDWLWDQFLRGVDELLESLQKRTTDAGAGVEVPVGDVPAFQFPTPTFYRDTGF